MGNIQVDFGHLLAGHFCQLCNLPYTPGMGDNVDYGLLPSGGRQLAPPVQLIEDAIHVNEWGLFPSELQRLRNYPQSLGLTSAQRFGAGSLVVRVGPLHLPLLLLSHGRQPCPLLFLHRISNEL